MCARTRRPLANRSLANTLLKTTNHKKHQEHAAEALRLARRALAVAAPGAPRDRAELEARLAELSAARFAGAAAAVAAADGGRRWLAQERAYAEAMAALAESRGDVRSAPPAAARMGKGGASGGGLCPPLF